MQARCHTRRNRHEIQDLKAPIPARNFTRRQQQVGRSAPAHLPNENGTDERTGGDRTPPATGPLRHFHQDSPIDVVPNEEGVKPTLPNHPGSRSRARGGLRPDFWALPYARSRGANVLA